MRRLRLLVLVLVASFATACGDYVSRSEFDTFKAGVQASGTAVDTWIASAHENIMWLRQIVIANHCGAGSSCDPPSAPPTPPPNGDWGS